MSPGAWDDEMASFISLRRQISAARGEGRLQENAAVLAIHIELTLCFCSAAASAALREHNA